MRARTGARHVVETFIEARNAHDYERATLLLASDVEWQVPRSAGEPLRGKEAINALVGGLAKQLFREGSEQRNIRRIVVDGRTAVVEYTVTGTTLDGNEYVNDYCWIYDVRDGLIVRVTSYSDTLGSAAAFGQERLAQGLAEVRRR